MAVADKSSQKPSVPAIPQGHAIPAKKPTAGPRAHLLKAGEKEWTILVEAHQPGTYPERGRLNAWLRQPGEQFLIQMEHDFRDEWMRLPGQDTVPDAAESRNGVPIMGHGARASEEGIPQTTLAHETVDPMQILQDQARGR